MNHQSFYISVCLLILMVLAHRTEPLESKTIIGHRVAALSLCRFAASYNGNVPVFQIISADQKSMHIAYFLRKIISKGNQAPRLITVAEIFAKCSDLRD